MAEAAVSRVTSREVIEAPSQVTLPSASVRVTPTQATRLASVPSRSGTSSDQR